MACISTETDSTKSCHYQKKTDYPLTPANIDIYSYVDYEIGNECVINICDNFPSHSKNLHQLVILRFLVPSLRILPLIYEYCPFTCGKFSHSTP